MDEKVTIDAEKIRDQVRREVMAEEKYWRENDAKMRAVEQRVPTYEDFKQIVMASHLKPLEKGETLRNAKLLHNNTWNPCVLHSSSATAVTSAAEQQPVKPPVAKPTTSHEFKKAWQRLPPDMEAKWAFLSSLGPDALAGQFSGDVNSDQLGDFLVLIERKLQAAPADPDTARLAFVLLRLFGACKRFSLNKMFLKAAEKDAFHSIVQLLRDHVSPADWEQLRAASI